MGSLRESRESLASGDGNQLLKLRFHYTRRMADIIREEEEKARKAFESAERKRIEAEEEHKRRYAIVEKIKVEMAQKEATQNLSLVDKYALEAQKEFM